MFAGNSNLSWVIFSSCRTPAEDGASSTSLKSQVLPTGLSNMERDIELYYVHSLSIPYTNIANNSNNL